MNSFSNWLDERASWLDNWVFLPNLLEVLLIILSICKYWFLLEQNWFVLYPLGFDDNKVFKEQLRILINVQVCKTIDLNLWYNLSYDTEVENWRETWRSES